MASAPFSTREAFLAGLSDAQLAALPYLFEFWALPHQLPPEGDWRAWVILGGRGAGKTRAGAEWVRAMVEGPRPSVPGRARRLALVAETIDQAREVMVFGESGIMAISPPDYRPQWVAGRRMLIWENGAQAQLFSAHEPESLRGPQFDAAWVDELAKWRRADDTWDMLQFGLRLGTRPQVCVTTTPRRVAILRNLLELDSTVMTHAPTHANRANLAPSFLAEVEARYGGTALGRQELAGELLSDVEGALWQVEQLAECQVAHIPDLTRIVVAIDPAGTSHAGSDECGIVVAGVVMNGPVQDWRAYVLEDASVPAARPADWGYRRFILHYAHLCAAAGGVAAFCIGSEMRGLTQIRGAGNSFPAVAALIQLAGEVRAILGPECKISYAADWTEYHGYQPAGTGDKFFHLDPLWADPNIDFIGIDNYMPLADWREGEDHADAGAGSIYDLDYLTGNVAGGEGYDWYYHSPEARDAQIRTPITDGNGEPWVWRYKDLIGWWAHQHNDRIDGVRQATPSPWLPQAKPIWFTEFGCAAIDKGANQPNKFLDPKSSESQLPYYSNGNRDDHMQIQYIKAVHRHFADPANNPVSVEYGAPMLDTGRMLSGPGTRGPIRSSPATARSGPMATITRAGTG